MYCDRCLKDFDESSGCYINSYKRFTFCPKHFEELTLINEKLADGWRFYRPQKDQLDEICNCNCCEH